MVLVVAAAAVVVVLLTFCFFFPFAPGCIYVKSSVPADDLSGNDASIASAQNIVPLFGFYKCNVTKTNKPLFDSCLFPASCLGAANPSLEEQYNLPSNQTNLKQGTCNTAYVPHSLLCHACKDGYSHHSKIPGKCDKCPSKEQNQNFAILGVVIGVVGTIIYVWVTLTMGFDETDGIKSIGLSFVQLLSLLTTFPIAWPEIFTQIFQVGGAITVLGQHFVDLKCLLEGTDVSDADVFYTFTAMWAVSAPTLVVACLFCWGVLRIVPCAKFASSCNQAFWGNVRASIVALLYLIYPALCAQTFSLFACRSICSEPNTLFLLRDLREVCYVGRHLDYVLGLGLPMLFLYVVGLPLAAYTGVKRLKKRALRKNKPSYTLKGHTTWQLFYAVYRKETWWWEVTVAGRKVIIAAIGVFGAVLGGMQTHVTSVVIVCIIMATSYVRPFTTSEDASTGIVAGSGILQGVEMVCLLALWLTLWAGSIFNTYPRCLDPLSTEGLTLGWCDALSLLVGTIDIAVILMLVIGFCYLVWRRKKIEQEIQENGGDETPRSKLKRESNGRRLEEEKNEAAEAAEDRGGQKKIHETPAQSQQQRTKKPEKTKSVEVQMSELATKKQVYDNPMNKNEVIKGGTGELSLDIKSDSEHLNAQQWDRYLDAKTNQWYRVNKLTGESNWEEKSN